MTQLQRILMAISAIFGRIFTLCAFMARGKGDKKPNGVNFLRVLCVIFFVAITTACGQSFEEVSENCKDKAETSYNSYSVIKYDSCMEDYKTKQLFLARDYGLYALVALVVVIIILWRFGVYGASLPHNASLPSKQTDTNSGGKSLHDAVRDGQTEILLAGVKAGKDINEKDDNGWTPLHWAARVGNTKNLLAVMNTGCNLHACDNDGKTAMNIAVESHGENSEIARILREAMEKQDGK